MNDEIYLFLKNGVIPEMELMLKYLRIDPNSSDILNHAKKLIENNTPLIQQESNNDIFDTTDEKLSDNCPNCGHEYDEIDYEYQICHLCNPRNPK